MGRRGECFLIFRECVCCLPVILWAGEVDAEKGLRFFCRKYKSTRQKVAKIVPKFDNGTLEKIPGYATGCAIVSLNTECMRFIVGLLYSTANDVCLAILGDMRFFCKHFSPFAVPLCASPSPRNVAQLTPFSESLCANVSCLGTLQSLLAFCRWSAYQLRQAMAWGRNRAYISAFHRHPRRSAIMKELRGLLG